MKDAVMNWATEHVVGSAKDLDAEVIAGLKANFEGECTEVGMYASFASSNLPAQAPFSASALISRLRFVLSVN